MPLALRLTDMLGRTPFHGAAWRNEPDTLNSCRQRVQVLWIPCDVIAEPMNGWELSFK
jgi:hypothetical protein